PSSASSRPATMLPVPCMYTSGSWPRVLVIGLPSSPVRVKWTVATRRWAISMGSGSVDWQAADLPPEPAAGATARAREYRSENRRAGLGPAFRTQLQRAARSAAARSLVAALHLGPVDHLEESRDVVRAAVLVLQVVRVLPHVQAQDRGVARANVLHQRVVLVGSVFHQELAVGVDDQPGPAAAEAALGGLGELLLEGVITAQVALDAPGDLALRLAAAVG